MSSRISLVVFLCILAAALLACAYMVWPYLLALLMGAVLALLAAPLNRKLMSRKVSPRLSAAIAAGAVTLLVVVPLFTFTAHAVLEAVEFSQRFRGKSISMQSLTSQVSSRVSRTFSVDLQVVKSNIRAASEKIFLWLTDAVVTLAATVPNILLQLVLSSITCFFLLLDGQAFLKWLSDKIPLDGDVRAELKQSFRNTAISVIWANLVAAGTQAAILVLGYLILGVPGAFLAGGVTFILAWIPMVGTVPVWIAGAVYLYSLGDLPRMAVMVIIGLISGIADNFVRPMILRGRSDMHPLVSLLAIFGGMNLFGIMGAFAGPILAAILISLLDIWPVVGRRFGLLKSTDLPGTPL